MEAQTKTEGQITAPKEEQPTASEFQSEQQNPVQVENVETGDKLENKPEGSATENVEATEAENVADKQVVKEGETSARAEATVTEKTEENAEKEDNEKTLTEEQILASSEMPEKKEALDEKTKEALGEEKKGAPDEKIEATPSEKHTGVYQFGKDLLVERSKAVEKFNILLNPLKESAKMIDNPPELPLEDVKQSSDETSEKPASPEIDSENTVQKKNGRVELDVIVKSPKREDQSISGGIVLEHVPDKDEAVEEVAASDTEPKSGVTKPEETPKEEIPETKPEPTVEETNESASVPEDSGSTAADSKIQSVEETATES